MKKFLLGTSALVGGALLLASTASAAEVNISGTLKTSIGVGLLESNESKVVNGVTYYNSNALDGSTQGIDAAAPATAGNPVFGNRLDDAALTFTVTEESDAGLVTTGVLDFEGSGGNLVLDEAYIKVGSTFIGEFTLGFDDGIDFGPLGNSALSGFSAWDGSHMNFLSAKTAGYVNRLAGFSNSGDDAGGIKYITPSFGGFKAGLSYKPSTVYGGDPSGSASQATGARNSGTCNFYTATGTSLSGTTNAGCGISFDRTDQTANGGAAPKNADTKGLANVISAGVDYTNSFGDLDLNAGLSGVFSTNGQSGGGGTNFGIRAGAKMTYQKVYSGALGVTYGQDKPYADTRKNAGDYLTVSLGGAYDYGAGSVSVGAGWQMSNRSREYTTEEYTATGDDELTPDQKAAGFTGIAADMGIVASVGGSYIVAPGVTALLDITYVIGLPGNDVKANYTITTGSALTGDDLTGDYPSGSGLAIGLGTKMTF